VVSVRVMADIFATPFGSPNRKMVALRLADFADDEGRGMWPTVSRIAAECEIHERTVQRILSDFVTEGILRIARAGGGRPGSSTRYDFDLATVSGLRRKPAPAAERAIEQAGETGGGVSPVAAAGEGRQGDTGDTASETGDTACREGWHGATRSTSEPSQNPPLEREREREYGQEGENGDVPEGQTRRAETLFYKSFKVWDRFDPSPKQPMLAAWGKLTWTEMLAAADAVSRYLAGVRAAGMRHAPAISSYLDLTERLWERYPPVAEALDAVTHVPPFGPEWGLEAYRALLGSALASQPLTRIEAAMVAAGTGDERQLRLEKRMRFGWPAVNRLFAQAADGKGFSRKGRAALDAGALMEAVPVGSAMFEAWRAEHAQRGWPWIPDPGRQPVVYFPAGGPDRLNEFEARIRSNDGDRHEAAE